MDQRHPGAQRRGPGFEGNGGNHEQHVPGFGLSGAHGGDEFAILGLEEAEVDFSKIRMRLQERTGLSGKDSARPYRLSLSMGFVEYDPEKPEGIDDLLARADKLMYVEKSIKKPRKG